MKYKISVECEYDGDNMVEDSFDDVSIINSIKKELEDGNTWAWCTVKVTLVFNDFELSEYLGGCSYDDKEDFIKNSGYYEDMVNNLKQTVIDAAKSLTI